MSSNHYPVIVIGAGQAGLSASYGLKQQGIAHLVLEKHRLGHSWREERWDSFCLVTPNWQCQLPGFAYPGPDPHGFMKKEQILDYLRNYAQRVAPQLKENTAVTSLEADPAGGFRIHTDTGDSYTADQVIVATGNYHVPAIPRAGERFDSDLLQLHSANYRRPSQLPDGAVLVIGSGQSGCQIAEDLHLAGRKVHLAVGHAPRSPRVYRGRDAVDWLQDLGYYDLSVEQHPLKDEVRHKTNHYLTGRDGGREIDLRQRALEGMQLYGRLANVNGTKILFEPDLAANLDAADAVYNDIRATIDRYIEKQGVDAPVEPAYQPPWFPEQEITEIDYVAEGVTSIVWGTGFRPDFSWIKLPVFDGRGEPSHQRGITPIPGLYFLGLSWLHTWGSGRFAGIERDSRHVVEWLAAVADQQPALASSMSAG